MKNRALRLLPGVLVVGVALLGLRAPGLVHDAYALAANADTPAPPADPKPINADFADNDEGIASAAQQDVLTSLARRRGELDAREARIKTESAVLTATEQRVDAKIAQLKTLQDSITKLLGQRDDAQKAQIAGLMKTYKTMPPKKAAPIFEALPDEVAIPVAQDMSAADLAAIMQFMSPDQAQKLTVKLASKLTLPVTADAAAPTPTTLAAASPAPAPAAIPAAAPATVPGPSAAAPPPAAKPKS